MEESTKNKINKVIIEIASLHRENIQIREEADLFKTYGYDSMDFVELCCELEKSLNINIIDEEWDKIRTVGDVYNLIEATLSR